MVIQDKLRPAVRKKAIRALAIWTHLPSGNMLLYTARIVIELQDECEWSVLEHPLYCTDLAPCDTWLFPKMKEHLCGHRFESEEEIIFSMKEAIRQLVKIYVTTFDSWLRGIQKCIDNGGCYV
ncbi:histone-lysine N-methyltransferase SETMAR [Plakobranchus ocellatus]|uniref:Histone-lysine N-methyltransferase SETMAR n=1 Tax=Plakobranchus ocellatus TaxID=259542 RepID=A0AAV3Y350_9GAST|nr:histone-lysine N-methyltransferase SETMAR [Plakobranchus ocellatus]